MDSMRSLNSSLPTSNSQNGIRRQHAVPSAELHPAFKAAAYSVAQLYKAAATDAQYARAAGYQDAIDELLAFLDEENLGLGDGEGWRVRQWATERFEPSVFASSRDEEDAEEEGVGQGNERQPTPNESKTTREGQPDPSPQQTTPQEESKDTTSRHRPPHEDPTTAPQPFQFNYVSDTEMSNQSTTNNPTSPSFRVNLRPSRRPSALHLKDKPAIPATSLGVLGAGAGSKRKALPYFEDIFNFGQSFGTDEEDPDDRGVSGHLNKKGRTQ